MAVLKKEFIDRMAENGGITKKDAGQGVDLFFETEVYNEPVSIDEVKYDGTVKVVRMWSHYDEVR